MAALMEVTCNSDSDSSSEREMEREVTVICGCTKKSKCARARSSGRGCVCKANKINCTPLCNCSRTCCTNRADATNDPSSASAVHRQLPPRERFYSGDEVRITCTTTLSLN
ncbi:uncharacterized protein LOC134181106 [Corticium candelabrum]|uniref:uncharacterized protein LOC134181106 n=1 Tax=Corticium candelabrum TaxID=121492 RepID=UPI002E26B41D|nr:uncharacterized protein LOC134181106 [Corticium candelabrum]